MVFCFPSLMELCFLLQPLTVDIYYPLLQWAKICVKSLPRLCMPVHVLVDQCHLNNTSIGSLNRKRMGRSAEAAAYRGRSRERFLLLGRLQFPIRRRPQGRPGLGKPWCSHRRAGGGGLGSPGLECCPLFEWKDGLLTVRSSKSF